MNIAYTDCVVFVGVLVVVSGVVVLFVVVFFGVVLVVVVDMQKRCVHCEHCVR